MDDGDMDGRMDGWMDCLSIHLSINQFIHPSSHSCIHGWMMHGGMDRWMNGINGKKGLTDLYFINSILLFTINTINSIQ